MCAQNCWLNFTDEYSEFSILKCTKMTDTYVAYSGVSLKWSVQCSTRATICMKFAD